MTSPTLTPNKRTRRRWKRRHHGGLPTPDALTLLRRGASLAQLSRVTGLTTRCFHNVFFGRVGRPAGQVGHLTTLLKIADALDVSVERLVTTIVSCDAAKRRDAERNAAERAANATLQRGAALLALEYRSTPPPEGARADWTDVSTLLTDGTGNIEIHLDYLKSKSKEAPGPPKLEWRTQGYVRLSPAQVNPDY
jgi:hypothetical protein